ncbi:MAG: hypothetical protein JNJ58_01885 [Chitinophagaceae bacterium]|nr:hypothetical protein [Chitinophagaceae bacterium]
MNYLIVTIEAGGNVPPVFNLVRQLIQRGHHVAVLTEPCLQTLTQQSGAHFIPFKEYFTKTDRTQDIFEDWKSKNISFDNVIFGPAEIVVRETIEHIRRTNADRLIVDVVLPTALIAGEAMHIPRICLFHMPEYLPGPNRPPGSLGLIPGQSFLGKLRDRLLGKVFHSIFNKYLPKINTIRDHLKLAPLKNIADLFHQADLRLIQTSTAFDFPILPAPQNVRYTGPVLDDPDWVSPWQNPWPAEDQRPLVVVSLSTTFQNQKQSIQHCMEAVSHLDVRALITLGPAMQKESFSIPDNVKVIAHASHDQIFPHANLVVTYGGHGTLMRALAHGLPLVCLPMGRDQDDNAAKVVYHRVGLKRNAKSSPAAIRSAIQTILSNPQFKANARKLGDQILADAKTYRLMEALESI